MSSLKHLIYGAAPMSIHRLKEALAVFGPVMTQIYGQSECHTLITVMRPDDHYAKGRVGVQVASDERLSACGRPSVGTTVEVRGKAGQILPAGEKGEICVRSDLRMSGYYDDPEATTEVLRDGVVHTGDVGFLDTEGFLHIVDRKKDVVISGGLNIYPSEVERALQAHDAVLECAVVGVLDEDWGEAVTAVVSLKPGHVAAPQDLIAHVKQRLGSVKTPKALFIWEELPRSAVGKVLKREIRRRLTGGLGGPGTTEEEEAHA